MSNFRLVHPEVKINASGTCDECVGNFRLVHPKHDFHIAKWANDDTLLPQKNTMKKTLIIIIAVLARLSFYFSLLEQVHFF
jgi:hypothetical protein